MSARGGKHRFVISPKFNIFTPTYGTTTGFPPADEILRDWLKEMPMNNADDVSQKFQGLLVALFSVTKKRLETIQSKRAGDLPLIAAIHISI